MLCYCFFDHRSHAPAVALGVDKSEAIKTLRSTPDDPRYLAIGPAVVGMKCSEQHGPIDAGPGCTQQIFFQWSISVPRTRQPIALSGMTVAIDNHGNGLTLKNQQMIPFMTQKLR